MGKNLNKLKRRVPNYALTTTERLTAYLKPRFAGAKQEKALLLSLDSRSRVRGAYWLREGTSSKVSFVKRLRSIFFSKCKQFSFICINRTFNNKMNYSEHKIIKNNFFENNVQIKINKVNTNIKMCLHHALCF